MKHKDKNIYNVRVDIFDLAGSNLIVVEAKEKQKRTRKEKTEKRKDFLFINFLYIMCFIIILGY